LAAYFCAHVRVASCTSVSRRNHFSCSALARVPPDTGELERHGCPKYKRSGSLLCLAFRSYDDCIKWFRALRVGMRSLHRFLTGARGTTLHISSIQAPLRLGRRRTSRSFRHSLDHSNPLMRTRRNAVRLDGRTTSTRCILIAKLWPDFDNASTSARNQVRTPSLPFRTRRSHKASRPGSLQIDL
jgi:hypothetical protein